MPEHLSARVEHCYQLAEAFFGRAFPRPEVSLRLRGQKAGVAHLHENLLRFNAKLYRENQQHFLQQTVAHEVAHLVAHQVFGPRIRPHGPEWQDIMRGVYGLVAERCHHYSVETKPRTDYLYSCACATDNLFPFTARRHALALQGRRYICRRCRSALIFQTTRQSLTETESPS